MPSLYRHLKQAVKERRKALLVTVVAADEATAVGKKGLFVYEKKGAPRYHGELPEPLLPRVTERAATFSLPPGRRIVTFEEEGGVRLAYELFSPKPRLAIVGAGHIAQPTHAFAAEIGFSVAVLDDRPAFANQERFSRADLVLCQSIAEGVGMLGIDEESAVVIVTRGHLHDLEALLALARLGVVPAYLGMIGSRRRVLTVLEALRQEQVDPSLLERLYAPIGLDIGADSPQEIALAIVAEILCVFRGASGGHLRYSKLPGGSAWSGPAEGERE